MAFSSPLIETTQYLAKDISKGFTQANKEQSQQLTFVFIVNSPFKVSSLPFHNTPYCETNISTSSHCVPSKQFICKILKTVLNNLHCSIDCQTFLFLKTVLKDIFSALPPPPLSSLGSSGGSDPLPPPMILEITLDMLHTVCFLLFSCSGSSILLTCKMAEFTSLSSSPGFSATEIS